MIVLARRARVPPTLGIWPRDGVVRVDLERGRVGFPGVAEHGRVAPSIVHDRVDYAGPMIDGRTVQEIDPRGRSAAEIRELWEFLKAQIANSTKARKTNSTKAQKAVV